MGMESIMGSLRRVLYLNVSSMNQEPAVTGLTRFCKNQGFEFEAYRYDEGKEAQYHYDGEVDHNIQRKVREKNPDLIIFSGPAAGKCRPQLNTLGDLQNKAKTVGYFLDGGCPEWHPVLQDYNNHNIFNLMVNTDGNPYWPRREHDLTLWQPVDEAFYEIPKTKDIMFGFAGGAGSKHRQEAIAKLRAKAGLVVAERYEAWGTYNKFSEFMLRCKVTINFPETGSSKAYHLKNRVIEAGFAGCVLFEKKNPITPMYFKPNEDYLEYETIEEVIGMLERPEPSWEGIAENLQRKALNQYGAEKFWGNIFDAISERD